MDERSRRAILNDDHAEGTTGGPRIDPSGSKRLQSDVALPDGGTRAGDNGSGVRAPLVLAGLGALLAVGQLLGILRLVAESPQLYRLLDPVGFVYAVPLGTLVQQILPASNPSQTSWIVFGLVYLAMYAVAIWFALGDGPSTSQRVLLKMFVAGNAAAYAILPALFVRFQLVQYYTSGNTLPFIVIYGLLMGAMYFAVGQPSDAPGEARDRERSRSTTEGDPNRGTRSGTRDQSEPVEARGNQSRSAASAGNQSPERAKQASSGATAGGSNRSREAREQRAGSPERAPRQGTPREQDTTSSGTRAERQSRADQTRAPSQRSGGSDPSKRSEQSQSPSRSEQSRPPADARATESDAPTTRDDSDDEGSGNELVDLFKRLKSSDRDERLAAAERIGEITWDDPSTVAAEPLAEAIEAEPDADVREALVVAIGSIDSAAAEQALEEARFDPDPNVSTRASNLLQ